MCNLCSSLKNADQPHVSMYNIGKQIESGRKKRVLYYEDFFFNFVIIVKTSESNLIKSPDFSQLVLFLLQVRCCANIHPNKSNS